MPVLYFFSNLLYLLIYCVFGYRKKVVRKNLSLVFPKKTVRERLEIEQKFYKHLSDMIFGGLKTISISKKKIKKRYKFKNIEVINTLLQNNKSIVLLASHYGNWEWAICLPFYAISSVNISYTSITNKYFNNLIKKTREKFNTKCIKSEGFIKNMILEHRNNKHGIYVLLISDQSPHIGKIHFWSDFLGIDIPVNNGGELMAKKFDFAVVNMLTNKKKRGYYETEFKLTSKVEDSSKDIKITELYLQELENQIRKQPEFYLWSHNRFKHMYETVKTYS